MLSRLFPAHSKLGGIDEDIGEGTFLAENGGCAVCGTTRGGSIFKTRFVEVLDVYCFDGGVFFRVNGEGESEDGGMVRVFEFASFYRVMLLLLRYLLLCCGSGCRRVESEV